MQADFGHSRMPEPSAHSAGPALCKFDLPKSAARRASITRLCPILEGAGVLCRMALVQFMSFDLRPIQPVERNAKRFNELARYWGSTDHPLDTLVHARRGANSGDHLVTAQRRSPRTNFDSEIVLPTLLCSSQLVGDCDGIPEETSRGRVRIWQGLATGARLSRAL